MEHHGDSERSDVLTVLSGDTLDCVPLLEMLDLSWNTGIGGGSLHVLTEHLHLSSSLRELHLLDCQLSEEDSMALGENLPAPTGQNLQYANGTVAV